MYSIYKLWYNRWKWMVHERCRDLTDTWYNLTKRAYSIYHPMIQKISISWFCLQIETVFKIVKHLDLMWNIMHCIYIPIKFEIHTSVRLRRYWNKIMFCLGRVNHLPVSIGSVALIILKIQYICTCIVLLTKFSVNLYGYYLLLINDSGSLLKMRHYW